MLPKSRRARVTGRVKRSVISSRKKITGTIHPGSPDGTNDFQ